jgi:hypothetical protein
LSASAGCLPTASVKRAVRVATRPLPARSAGGREGWRSLGRRAAPTVMAAESIFLFSVREGVARLHNRGRGAGAGSVYITDRTGRAATVDLSGAITMQDVLTDTTGRTDSNLTVEEAGYGTAAADLVGGGGSGRQKKREAHASRSWGDLGYRP